jgi:hypothetical protein
MPVKGLLIYFEMLVWCSMQFCEGDDDEGHVSCWFLPLLPIAPILYVPYALVVTAAPRAFSFMEVSPIPTNSRLYEIRYYVKGQEDCIADYLRDREQRSAKTGSPSVPPVPVNDGVPSTLPTDATSDTNLQVGTGAGNYPLVANPLRREAALPEGTKPSEPLQSSPITKSQVDASKTQPTTPAKRPVAAQPILFTPEDIKRMFSTEAPEVEALQMACNAVQAELQLAREEIKAMRSGGDQTQRELSLVREEMKAMNHETQALLRALLKQNPGK